MSRGGAVAVEAQSWVGTRFKWQGRCKGVGCDCKGLLWGVAAALDYPEAHSRYARHADYSKQREVPISLLREGMDALFDRANDYQPGDVLLLNLRGKPQHLAIVVSPSRAVHSVRRYGVVNERIEQIVKSAPLVQIYRWRDGR